MAGIFDNPLYQTADDYKRRLSDALRQSVIGEIAVGGLSNLESLGRGAASSLVGLGDIEGLARKGINWSFGPGGVNVSEKPVLPTAQDVRGMFPRLTPARQETAGMEFLGEAMSPVAAKGIYGAGKSIQSTPPIGSISYKTRESFVPGVEAGKELIVHHNISPEKLARVERVGGMPVPSLAISNVETPLTGFGDITLVGKKEMAIPSAKNPVFGFDAYTARAPKIDYQIDHKSAQKLENIFSDIKNDLSDYDAKTGVYRLLDNWGDKGYSEIMKVKFLKEKGMLPNKQDFAKNWEYSSAIEQNISNLKSEYADWLNNFDNKLPELGINVKERIFKGFTNAGNRKYADVTLENLVKEMKGGAGSENFNYGLGNLRAISSPKFKSLNEIKASREKIVSNEQFKKLKDEMNEAHSSLSERIAKLGDQSGYGYRPEDVLYDIGQSKNVNLIDKFKVGADDQLKADIGIFMNKLKKLPTEYFEIKPQRAVSVSEFQGAILPEDVPISSINYLKNQGLNDLYFYATPEQRKELLKKFGNQMFGAAPIGVGIYGNQEIK